MYKKIFSILTCALFINNFGTNYRASSSEYQNSDQNVRVSITKNRGESFSVDDVLNQLENTVFYSGYSSFKIEKYENIARVRTQIGKIIKREKRQGLDIVRELASTKDKRAKQIIKFLPGVFREKVTFRDLSKNKPVPGVIRCDGYRGQNTSIAKIEIQGFIDQGYINFRQKTPEDKQYKHKPINNNNGIFPKIPKYDPPMNTQNTNPAQGNELRNGYGNQMNKPTEVRRYGYGGVYAAPVDDDFSNNTPRPSAPQGNVRGNRNAHSRNTPMLVTADHVISYAPSMDKPIEVQFNGNSGNGKSNKNYYAEDSDEDSENLISGNQSNGAVSTKSLLNEINSFSENYEGKTLRLSEYPDGVELAINKLFGRKNRKWTEKLETKSIKDKKAKEFIKLKRGVYRFAVTFVDDNGVFYNGALRLDGISKNIFRKNNKSSGVTYQFFIGDEAYKDIDIDSVVRSIDIQKYSTKDASMVEKRVNAVLDGIKNSNALLAQILQKNPGHINKIKTKLIEIMGKKSYNTVRLPVMHIKDVYKENHQGDLVIIKDNIRRVPIFGSKAGKNTLELSFKDLGDNGKIKYIYMHFRTIRSFTHGRYLRDDLISLKGNRLNFYYFLHISLTKNKNFAQGKGGKQNPDDIEEMLETQYELDTTISENMMNNIPSNSVDSIPSKTKSGSISSNSVDSIPDEIFDDEDYNKSHRGTLKKAQSRKNKKKKGDDVDFDNDEDIDWGQGTNTRRKSIRRNKNLRKNKNDTKIRKSKIHKDSYDFLGIED